MSTLPTCARKSLSHYPVLEPAQIGSIPRLLQLAVNDKQSRGNLDLPGAMSRPELYQEIAPIIGDAITAPMNGSASRGAKNTRMIRNCNHGALVRSKSIEPFACHSVTESSKTCPAWYWNN